MTPEKEVEILRWLNDNYPNHETSVVKVWELVKILDHYHNSEVKKLNKPAVSVVREPIVVGAVCPHFQECINAGKNEYCDIQTLKEIDCFIGQTER